MKNWQRFSYITVGRILEELHQDGLTISRDTFIRLEREGLFLMGKTVGGYRRCTREEAELIKRLIKQNFAFVDTEKKHENNT